MKFAIVGTGGTGGTLGAYLASHGQDVTFIARGNHLAAIRQNGLTIRTEHRGDIVIKPAKACTMDEYTDTPDVMLVCVKYYNIDDAIALARRTANADTLIVPILNVFGTGEVMQQALPGLTCLDGCMYIFAKIQEPGVIVQPEKILRVFFGFRPGQDDRLSTKAKELEQIMQAADIHAHFTKHIQRDALQKFAFVSPMGAAGLYFEAVSDDFQHEGPLRDFFTGLIREVVAIGHAMGITWENDLVETGLKMIDAFKPGLRTSMQRDVLAGKPSEFSGLVSRIVALGKKYDVPTPLYQKVDQWGQEHHIR
ncbi:2-dehydropantoate 2-reductase [Selenomonas sp.]|uniref:ketopantoate reductase family protein n=1 Tax=Selenomonas sp. TaxID=2053611 RepID=UPI0025D99432|nr:2-dehydropantoate 2-reductase [Selenomonas sp.]MBQ1867226.1 2-dehydropantoate 2-reductase [Selenomonas sp.]